jgi:uncharacterized membrane protein YphA (DoxX/SURF4 family)
MTSAVTLNLQPARARTTNLIARYLPAAGRLLFGLLLLVSGLNGLLSSLPQPSASLSAGAIAFVDALMATGYMFPLIMATQLIAGSLLLSNRFVPLALALLAPFMVNSIAFHVFLERSGRPMAFVVLALELYLVWVYRRAYAPMLSPRTTTNSRYGT